MMTVDIRCVCYTGVFSDKIEHIPNIIFTVVFINETLVL